MKKTIPFKQIPLLKDVPADAFNHHVNHFAKGAMIYQTGEKSQSLDIILEGLAVIQHINYEGQLITLTTFGKGDTIGGNRMFSSNSLFPMTITALEEVILLRIEKETVLQLCQKYNSFLVQFLEDIANKSDLLSTKFKSMSFMNIEDRVTKYLLQRSKKEKTLTIELPFSKKVWSEMLGVQRTSLSRVLQKMKKDGLIDYHNRTIILLELEKI